MRKQPNKNTKVKRNSKEAPRPRRTRSMNPFATKLSAHVTDEGEWVTEPPNLTLSRMFLVVLLLHIVIVGGILAFEMFKDESVAAPASASATALTEGRNTLGTSFDLGKESRRYRVKGGDTLSHIAHIHGVSSDQIMAMNRLGDSDQIYVGQMLSVPAGAIETPVPKPSAPEIGSEAEVVAAALSGDFRPEGAQVFAPREGTGSPVRAAGVTTTVPVPAPAPNVVSVPPSPTDSPNTHTVLAGETAYAISRRYGVSVHDLLKKNGIADANVLHVGSVLRIP